MVIKTDPNSHAFMLQYFQINKKKIIQRNNKMTSLKQILWFGFLTISSIQFSKSNNFESNVISIESIFRNEADTITKIQDYLTQEQERLQKVKKLLHNWKKWRILNTNKESEYIAIPQNLIQLFKRSTFDLRKLESTMKRSDKSFIDWDDIKEKTNYLLKQVAFSLIDQQQQYDLSPEDIMNGTLMDVHLDTSLSLDSCYSIGKICAEFNNHRCAVDWLEACLSLSSDKKFDLAVDKLVYPSHVFLNQTEIAFDRVKNYLNYDYYNRAAFYTYMDLANRLNELDDEDTYTKIAEQICRRNHDTYPNDRHLKCRYNHENSDFLKIAPLKEEELHHYPKILLYRDVVHDSEIEILKSEAAKELKVALLAGANRNTRGFVYRISETAFIDNQGPILSQLTERIKDISDLSLDNSEWWQMVNYSPGGFYILHSDFLSTKSKSVQTTGNRIATMLFYLNEVTLGGETVFPRIGLSVKPTKGIALVWHNIHNNDTKNRMVDHYACPVVRGEKWGFTQWIRSFNQTCLRKFYEYDPTILHLKMAKAN